MAEHSISTPDDASEGAQRAMTSPDLMKSLKSRPVAAESGFKIFAGNAHPALAANIARCLGVPLGQMVNTRFANGESWCAIDESIRGADVFIVQPTCAPVNDTLMELLIMCDAFRRASAKITVLSVAEVCAQAILRIHHDDSVSTMFENSG